MTESLKPADHLDTFAQASMRLIASEQRMRLAREALREANERLAEARLRVRHGQAQEADEPPTDDDPMKTGNTP